MQHSPLYLQSSHPKLPLSSHVLAHKNFLRAALRCPAVKLAAPWAANNACCEWIYIYAQSGCCDE